VSSRMILCCISEIVSYVSTQIIKAGKFTVNVATLIVTAAMYNIYFILKRPSGLPAAVNFTQVHSVCMSMRT